MVFIEDQLFERHRKGILDDDELIELFKWMAMNPAAGKVIPRSGGLRKLRWAASGKGKRGGARIIYFWWTADDHILLLDLYQKNEREDLSANEMRILKGKVIK